MILKNKKGFSVLEPVLTIGLMAIIFLSLSSLLVVSSFDSYKNTDFQEGLWYAQDGVSAIKTMEFDDLFETASGSLNFVTSSQEVGGWQLLENGPENVGKFTREILVSSIRRDSSCGISGNQLDIVDLDTFKIESNVTWQDTNGEMRDISLESFRTNWQNPSGSCFVVNDSCLSIDISSASWSGGKQLREVYFTNTCEDDFDIDSIVFTWDYNTKIMQTFLDNHKIWSNSGPGSPSGDQTSGTELFVHHAEVDDEETIELHKTQFTENMEGSAVSITVYLEDGSSVSTGIFTPSY